MEKEFKTAFRNSCNPKANMFTQDGNSQNSEAAVTQTRNPKATQLKIPARNPDNKPYSGLAPFLKDLNMMQSIKI